MGTFLRHRVVFSVGVYTGFCMGMYVLYYYILYYYLYYYTIIFVCIIILMQFDLILPFVGQRYQLVTLFNF